MTLRSRQEEEEARVSHRIPGLSLFSIMIAFDDVSKNDRQAGI
jgi:hypothetical protein